MKMRRIKDVLSVVAAIFLVLCIGSGCSEQAKEDLAMKDDISPGTYWAGGEEWPPTGQGEILALGRDGVYYFYTVPAGYLEQGTFLRDSNGVVSFFSDGEGELRYAVERRNGELVLIGKTSSWLFLLQREATMLP